MAIALLLGSFSFQIPIIHVTHQRSNQSNPWSNICTKEKEKEKEREREKGGRGGRETQEEEIKERGERTRAPLTVHPLAVSSTVSTVSRQSMQPLGQRGIRVRVRVGVGYPLPDALSW